MWWIIGGAVAFVFTLLAWSCCRVVALYDEAWAEWNRTGQ